MIKAGLIGVSGYTGMELVRLLATHNEIELVMASSRQEVGKKIAEIYPFMSQVKGGDIVIQESYEANTCEVLFLAVPHGIAMNMVPDLLKTRCKIIDLSADFRLKDKYIFETWYKTPHTAVSFLEKAVYGLPELYSKEIAKAQLVANPGCYPTASILGLYPALKENFIETDSIVIDAKSGVTGAGRKAAQNNLYCEVTDSFKAYGLTTHRHTPEIEQEVSHIAGKNIVLSFNPHLVPMNRGILATIYTKLLKNLSIEEIHSAYCRIYEKDRFIRVLPINTLPETRFVKGSMFCDIGLSICKRTNRLIITSAIDNLCRGASGQALANANLMFNLPLGSGLLPAPLMP